MSIYRLSPRPNMRYSTFLSGLLLLLSTAMGRDWMGVGKPADRNTATGASRAMLEDPPMASPARPAQTKADTAFLSRSVRSIPVGSRGDYLGNLEGVRCFNCAPNTVHLNVSDSLSREAGFVSLRLEVWNAVDRPVRDRRMYDFENSCFFFGYRAVDTAFVGGELTEIRLHDIPCYPYLQRLVRNPSTPPADTLAARPADLPAPAQADSPAPAQALQADPD